MVSSLLQMSSIAPSVFDQVGGGPPLQKARWGLLSTARVNRHMVASALGSLVGGIAAVASRSLDKAQAYIDAEPSFSPVTASSAISGEEVKGKNSTAAPDLRQARPIALGSYEELNQRNDIDIVYISLPNGQHKDAVLASLRSGKHVLCEKPMAMRERDVAELFAAAKANNCLLMEGLMCLHSASLDYVRDALRVVPPPPSESPDRLRTDRPAAEEQRLPNPRKWRGLGRIVSVQANFTFTFNRGGHRLSEFRDGGGSLWDVGVYPISVARWVLSCAEGPTHSPVGGEPCWVSGHFLGPSDSRRGVSDEDVEKAAHPLAAVDECFSGSLGFPNGCVMQFHVGFVGPYAMSMTITGTEGSITLRNPYKPDPVKGDVIDLVVNTTEGTIAQRASNPSWASVSIGPITETSTWEGRCTELPPHRQRLFRAAREVLQCSGKDGSRDDDATTNGDKASNEGRGEDVAFLADLAAAADPARHATYLYQLEFDELSAAALVLKRLQPQQQNPRALSLSASDDFRSVRRPLNLAVQQLQAALTVSENFSSGSAKLVEALWESATVKLGAPVRLEW